MREIKFRLWDNEIEQMSYDVSIFANGFRKAFFNSGEERVYNLPTIEWIKLMQFTGLHDKNGTPIYEGDILEWDIEEWGAPFNELVQWEYDQFSTRKNDWKQFCKVVGNRFENPELLKEEVK